jgi:hypothetical protein
MPAGARTTGAISTTKTTTTTGTAVTNIDLNPIPAVEMIDLIDGDFREGKLVAATGVIRVFDRAALEQEFGAINFGSAKIEEFENEPVLVMGARQFAELKLRQPQIEQQAALVEPEPLPEPEVFEPAPEPEPAPVPEPQEPAVVEPEPAPEPEVEVPSTLPKTATPLPVVGLAGLLSLMAELGLRICRR